MADERLFSGFMNHDYILTFSIGDAAKRQKLAELCDGPWQGDEVTDGTWEISNDLGPDDMEKALIDLVEEGDRIAYYYLTPPLPSGIPAGRSGGGEAKRIFRVIIR